MPQPESANDGRDEIHAVLEKELACLPEKYRAVLVLCDLEGKPRRQAAQQLGWPQGTVASQLTRARALLAKRLTRQGLALSGASLAMLLSKNLAPAAVSAPLLVSTIRAANLLAAGQAVAAGAISTRVAILTEGMLKAMFVTKLKNVGTMLLVIALLGAGVGILPGWSSPAEQGKERVEAKSEETPLVPALDLLRTANSNAAAFDVKYLGKRIQVKGTLAKVEREDAPGGRRTYIAWLLAAGPSGQKCVACRFADPKPLAELHSGDALVVEGEVLGHRKGPPVDGSGAKNLGLSGGQFGMGGAFGGNLGAVGGFAGTGGGQLGGGLSGGQLVGGGLGGGQLSGGQLKGGGQLVGGGLGGGQLSGGGQFGVGGLGGGLQGVGGGQFGIGGKAMGIAGGFGGSVPNAEPAQYVELGSCKLVSVKKAVLSPSEAVQRLNEKVTVLMPVRAIEDRLEKQGDMYLYAEKISHGLDRLRIVITKDGAAQFPADDADGLAGRFKERTILVKGVVIVKDGQPLIEVNNASQIEFVE